MASSNNKEALFPIGRVGQRELREALKKSRNPAETIRAFQTDHSLNAMLAKAFGTIPQTSYNKTRNAGVPEDDTDSAMLFLSHLGVRQQYVHEKISTKLLKQLEDAIQKTTDEAMILKLLSSCWVYVGSITELEPVLLAVLKRLGSATPVQMLQTLVERTDSQSQELKYQRIFDKLQYTLKRLCWESDWDQRVTNVESNIVEEHWKQMQSTLFFATVYPLIERYISKEKLQNVADLPFVETLSERKLLTVQRRAVAKQSIGEAIRHIGTLIGFSSSSTASALLQSSSSASQRPNLLYAVISILMHMHGQQAESKSFLGGRDHLHCSLLADLLVSLGGPLPKAYADIVSLARILDECVQEGTLSDTNLIKVQAILRILFPADGTSGNASNANDQEGSAKAALSNAELRHLNQIITTGLTELKEADPQKLFLNPVTDAIAPGYSKIIKRPMCVSTMEEKIALNQYTSVQKWVADVELMFRNCITYNRGPAGQWFRGEANRQAKHFRETIVPPKVSEIVVQPTKKREPERPAISPLEPMSKKWKKGKDEKLPSMPALASMLLSDPFVVRIIIDRILRELHRQVVNGNMLPPSHVVIPSLLQLLHIARWSKQICAMRGRKFFMSSAGLEYGDDPATLASYKCLRKALPTIAGLMLEAEFDHRCSSGGDLHPATQVVESPPNFEFSFEAEFQGQESQIVTALLEGAFVMICQPGKRNDVSLDLSFPKFGSALQTTNSPFLCDRLFFGCLFRALIRYKTKLPKSARDSIVKSWTGWLGNDKSLALTSSAHEHIVKLFNFWSSMGNVLLPRNDLLKFTKETITVMGTDEFVKAFRERQDSSSSFWRIKELYLFMLKQLPSEIAKQWLDELGLDQAILDEKVDAKKDEEGQKNDADNAPK